ncbi:hypothetical protein IIC38_11800 [candidate division KSB1 bacterium]|nr:hypothetical protein [candidate division KSB1 bacterium]
MKKVMLVVSVVSLVIFGLTQDSILWSFRLFLDEPIVHNVEKGEYLSQLSIKYYGTPDYWKELALINRAPNPNLVHPNENIIIPDLESIKQLHKAKTITKVNKLVRNLENVMIHPKKVEKVKKATPGPQEKAQPVIQKQTQKEESKLMLSTSNIEPESSSIMPIVLLIILGFLIVGGIVYWIFKRGKERFGETDFQTQSEEEFEPIEQMEEERPFENKSKKILEDALAN